MLVFVRSRCCHGNIFPVSLYIPNLLQRRKMLLFKSSQTKAIWSFRSHAKKFLTPNTRPHRQTDRQRVNAWEQHSLYLMGTFYVFTGMLISFPSIDSVSWSLNAEQSSILWMPRNPNQSDWFLRKTKPKKKERKKKNQSRVESLHNFFSFAISIKRFAWNPEIASPHSCFWKSKTERKGFGLGFLEKLPEKKERKKERKTWPERCCHTWYISASSRPWGTAPSASAPSSTRSHHRLSLLPTLHPAAAAAAAATPLP